MPSDSLGIYTKYIHPLYIQGKTEGEIAKELGMEEGYVKEVIAECLASHGEELFRECVGECERLIVFVHRWHPRRLALFIFQSHLKDILPVVFYIGLVGTKGTAKTTVLEIIRELCYKGVTFANGSSVARISRESNEGSTICIDEFDELTGDTKTTLESMVRSGYRRDSAIVGKWDLKKNTGLDIDPFGPKAMSFRKNPTDATLSRMSVIGMAEVRPSSSMTNRIIDILIRDEGDLQTRIKAYCDRLKKEWTLERVKTLMNSEPFRDQAVELTKASPSNRATEIAIISLAISDVIGVDLRDLIVEALEAQGEVESDFKDEFKETVKSVWEALAKPPKASISDLRKAVNAIRLAEKEKILTPDSFRALLRDIGARDDVELRRLTGGKHGVFFTQEFIDRLYESASLSPKIASLLAYETSLMNGNGDSGFTTNDSGFTTASEITDPIVKLRHALVKQRERESSKQSEGIGMKSEGQPSSSLEIVKSDFTRTDLYNAADEAKIPREKADRILQQWLDSREVYQPRLNAEAWRFT